MKYGKMWLAIAAVIVAGGVAIQAKQHLSATADSAQIRPSASAKPGGAQPSGSEPAQTAPDLPTVPAWAEGNLLGETISRDGASPAVVTNPSSLYAVVNKKRNLPSDYVPGDLTVPDVPFSFSGNAEKKQMRQDAAAALEKLFAGAENDGIELKAVSGYRSYARQQTIFNQNARKEGEEAANRTSARPGQSEHQTGLAMDVSSASVGYALDTRLGEMKEGIWLAAHAAEYGFIIRYPKDKQDETGYTYEPWHIRYVGKEAARDIARSGLTLEQYYEKLESKQVNG